MVLRAHKNPLLPLSRTKVKQIFKRTHPREIGDKVAVGASNTGHQSAKEKSSRDKIMKLNTICASSDLQKRYFKCSFKSVIRLPQLFLIIEKVVVI